MGSSAEILENAARQSGCQYVEFSQKDMISILMMEDVLQRGQAGYDGMCFGLSVAWGAARLKGIPSDIYLERILNWNTASSLLGHAHLLQVNQLQPYDTWNRMAGLKLAKKDGLSKSDSFRYDLEGMKKLAAWLGHSTQRRFIRLDAPRHTMGACGSRMGVLEFFDPNAGVISSRFASKLAHCLFDYFNDPHIKTAYKSNLGAVILDAQKYHRQ